MIHLGDITKINGAEIPVVDCITGGSPCQDLSIAGKRAGLAGERSGLYMEQIRVVKEMREHDRANGRTGQFIRPRFMVWENVPGAFSSNKGQDFAAVLEEAVKIAEPKAPPVPMPAKGWPTSGCLVDMDGRWSVAWRVHDAQFWGVPQRRRRIALVCDFGGRAAPEVLFEHKGMSWDSSEVGQEREETAGGTGSGACKAVSFIERGGCAGGGKGVLIQREKSGTLSCCNAQMTFCMATQQGGAEIRTDDKAPTLTAAAGMSGNNQPVICLQGNGDAVAQAFSFDSLASNSMKSKNPNSGCRAVDVAKTLDTTSPDPSKNQGGIAILQNTPNYCAKENFIYDARGNGDGKTVCTITGDHANRITDYTPVAVETFSMQGFGDYKETPTASACKSRDYKDSTDLIVAAVDCRNGTENQNVNGTLQAKSSGGMSLSLNNVCRQAGRVRRLTPLECERLQGYPDNWTDIGAWTDSKGKLHKSSSDSARYRAAGNSIALPFWFWLLRRISALYERPATLGSLFDGIGGFPLCWERCNGKGTALWASEIEEFAIAVTKLRFE